MSVHSRHSITTPAGRPALSAAFASRKMARICSRAQKLDPKGPLGPPRAFAFYSVYVAAPCNISSDKSKYSVLVHVTLQCVFILTIGCIHYQIPNKFHWMSRNRVIPSIYPNALRKLLLVLLAKGISRMLALLTQASFSLSLFLPLSCSLAPNVALDPHLNGIRSCI